MTEPKSQDSQQDLFGWQGAGQVRKAPGPPPGGLTQAQKPILVTTSLEQVLLVTIVAILAGCLIFFLGVLRGKSIGREGVRPPVTAAAAPAAAVVPAPAAAPRPAARQAAVVREPLAAPQQPAAVKAYTIQLVTYKKREWAEKEAAPFRAEGMYTAIVPAGEYFIVCVGQYGTKDEAKKDLKRLLTKYKDCYLRRHP